MIKSLRFILLLLATIGAIPSLAFTPAGTWYLSNGQTQTIWHNVDIPTGARNLRWETTISGVGTVGVDIIEQNTKYCIIKANSWLKYNDVILSFKFEKSQSTWSGINEATWVTEFLIKYKEPEEITIQANPSGGLVEVGTKVKLTPSVSGASIYYTTDGSTPTTSSTLYTSSGITIIKTTTLKAKAFLSGYEGKVGTWTYTVKTPVERITLKPEELNLKPGQTETVAATVYPDNAADKSVTWESSNTTVATVSSAGVVTAKAEGTAKITCKAKDGSGVTAVCEVKVEDAVVAEINAQNFPDANFRNYLLSQDYGKDGKLTESEIQKVTSIDVSKKEISSLKGIEYFTALEILYCYENQLTALDVSKNTALTSLRCYKNQLTALDVSKNTALTTLHCYTNQLTSLDVSKNTALKELDCKYNQLTTLDVSKNTALTRLVCSDNQLTVLDVSKNTALTSLFFYYNQVTTLDVSKNNALKALGCGGNPLKVLDVSKNTALGQLNCQSNQLTALDVTKNMALRILQCNNNQLTSLDISKNTALEDLWCGSNQLTSLDVSKNTALKTLSCSDNQLTSLDVSKNTALTSLTFYANMIKGTAMDALIASLPKNTTSEQYRFCLHRTSVENEGNVCTKAQVAAVKAKGWFPCYYDDNTKEYVEYEGDDASVLIDKISLDRSTLTLDEGKTYQLTATITPSNATDKSVTWSSSNTSIATVSGSGLVTARSAGTATITCKANDGSGKSASCKVTVESTPADPDIYMTSIQSGNADLTSLTKEDKLSLTATFKNYGATTAAMYARLWIFDLDMETVSYSDYQSYPFNADSETTVSIDYALTDIPAGNYLASILYYDSWDSKKWIYNSRYLLNIEVVDSSPVSKGDVNEDGKVNGTDLVALTNIILGKNAQKTAADVNGDGRVNGTDYVALANIILGKSASSRGLGSEGVSGPSALQVEPFSIRAGETKELLVSLSNPDDELTLLQFDLLLPDGLRINKVGDEPGAGMGSRTDAHSHRLAVYADGQRVRCLLASPGNELISGTEGTVVRLTVTAAPDYCGGMLALADAIGVTPAEQEIEMPSRRYDLTDGATAITGVRGADVQAEVYSLTGQRQSAVKRGINIVNGKKIIKK